jgi:hypothetical protein
MARLSVGDFKDAAALLRCAAKYLEAVTGEVGSLSVVALRER